MPPPSNRLLVAATLFAATLCSTSCTLAKPVVCAVTTPIYLAGGIGNSGGFCGCHGDGEAVLCLFAFSSAVGAVGGLVTGIISDVNYVCGYTEDPARNLHDPFATNTSCGTFR